MLVLIVKPMRCLRNFWEAIGKGCPPDLLVYEAHALVLTRSQNADTTTALHALESVIIVERSFWGERLMCLIDTDSIARLCPFAFPYTGSPSNHVTQIAQVNYDDTTRDVHNLLTSSTGPAQCNTALSVLSC